MSRRVFVGMPYSEAGFVTGVVIAVLGFGGAVLAAALDAEEAVVGVLAVFGGIGFLVAFTRHLKIAKNRRWITPTDTGFVLVDPRGEFEFTDDMVSDLATWAKFVYSNGTPSAHRRNGSFVLTVGEASVTFAFQYDFPLGTPDPLGEMFDRIFNKLVAAAKATLQRGGRLVGEGWSLDRTQFVYEVGTEDVSVPVGEITAVDLTEGRICVWRKDEAGAILRVKADSPNALILGRVLQDLMPETTTEDEPADGLGRIIFERDQSIRGANRVAGVILISFGLLTGLGILGFGIVDENPVGLIGLAIVLGCVIGAVALWNRRINMFRCHAFGVARTTPRGVTKLQYRSIGTFTYSGIRQYVNGAYQGTTITMRFEPLEDVDAEAIDYSATFKNADEELDNLRDFISRVVAGHMFRRLREGQTVRWTKNIRFLPDGLEVVKSGWFGGKSEPRRIPYSELGEHEIVDGVFRLGRNERGKWLVEEAVSQPNFFPGFVLMMMILHPPEDVSGGGEPGETT